MRLLFESVVMESLSSYLPERRVDSEEIEERLLPLYNRLQLPQGRLELMTGIKERRVWPPGVRPSDLSIEAGNRALAQSSLAREEIDVLIHASVCRDDLEPSTASRVHHALELSPHCMVFDVSNACLGVMNAWILLANMIESKMVRSGMVVAGENAGPLLEETINFFLNDKTLTRQSLKKYFANLTIGSGAFASVLTSKERAPHAPRLLGGALMNRTQDHGLCHGGGTVNALQMETDSEKLLAAGLELAKNTWEKAKVQLGWDNKTPDHVITHQVGRAHQEGLYGKLGLDMQKDFSTYDRLGNTGSTALPITLFMGKEKGLFKRGDLLALLGIGSGLHSVMLGVEWN